MYLWYYVSVDAGTLCVTIVSLGLSRLSHEGIWPLVTMKICLTQGANCSIERREYRSSWTMRYYYSVDLETVNLASVYVQNPLNYHSVPGKRPCTTFQGATVAASIQTYMYVILIPGKRPCGPKSWVIRDTTAIAQCVCFPHYLIVLESISRDNIHPLQLLLLHV